MVRVDPSLVLTGVELLDARHQVVEGDGEVLRVASGGLECEPGVPEHADPHERQDREAHQRWLLGELLDGHASRIED